MVVVLKLTVIMHLFILNDVVVVCSDLTSECRVPFRDSGTCKGACL